MRLDSERGTGPLHPAIIYIAVLVLDTSEQTNGCGSRFYPYLDATILILYLRLCIYLSFFFSMSHMQTELSEINLLVLSSILSK